MPRVSIRFMLSRAAESSFRMPVGVPPMYALIVAARSFHAVGDVEKPARCFSESVKARNERAATISAYKEENPRGVLASRRAVR